MPAPVVELEGIIIDVDDGSFNGLKDKLGRWPWSRRVWSAMLYHLKQGRPTAIIFDSIFGGNESEAADKEFAARIDAWVAQR